VAIIACAQDCLGRRSLECQQLLTWARVKAMAGDKWEASISENCQEFSGRPGWSRSSFELRRSIALRRTGINAPGSRRPMVNAISLAQGPP
jgi:hypothetical protein